MHNVAADQSKRAVRMRRCQVWWLLSIVLGLLAAPGAASAQFTRFQNYTDEQGLDNLDTTAINQDPTGYMLFGTQGGLFRSDGSSIVAYGESVGLASALIRQIAIDPFGHTWVVARDGISVLRGTGFTKLGDGTQFTDMEAPLLVAFGAGRVVVNNDGTLLSARLTDRKVGPFTPLLENRTLSRLPRPDKTGFVVATGRDGFAFRCGTTICQLDGSTVSVLDPAAGRTAETWQTALQARDGTLWVRSLHHLAWRPAGSGAFSMVDIPNRDTGYYAGGPELLSLAEDAQGRIYTQDKDGLLVWDKMQWHAMPHHLGGLSSNPIQGLFFDREGSLWVGSDGNGVYRSIGLGQWEHWTAEDGLPGEVWSTARLSNGRLWAATYSGTTGLGDTSMQIPGTNSALAKTHGGRLWAAPYGADLVRYDPADNRISHFHSVGTVRTAFVDSRNRLWLSTRDGLVLIDDADAPADAINPQVLLQQGTRQVVESPSGEIWATASGGLFRLAARRFQQVIGREHLPAQVSGLQFAPDGSLWASTSGLGIARFRVDGAGASELPRLGTPILPSNNVMFVFRDSRDRMWVGTDRGLEVLDHGSWHLIDSAVGPITNDLNAYGAFEDNDGSLWFSTTRGLSHYLDPAKLPLVRALHPVITGIALDSRPMAPVATLRVAANAGSLSIHFTDLDYASGRGIAFRYRLVGVDRGWNETTAHEVRYASLPAGHLWFQLQAVDTMHGSVSQPSGFLIKVEAPWWQRWWFCLGCLAAVAVLVAMAWRLRLRMRTRQEQRQTEEREQLEHLVRLRTAEIEQARSELQRLAMTDMLTGLPNRRAIMLMLDSLIARTRDDDGIGVLLCDIDHFKIINDSWGHQAGDGVLAAFGALLRNAAPDRAGRYGGEEFLVILHGGRRDMETIARAVLASITDGAPRIGEIPQPVTTSAGLAILRPADTTATLIARADTALYRAKRTGRNRLEVEAEQQLQFAMSG